MASRTTPTLWVLVIAIGPSSTPLSSSHVVPVISPLPFSVNHAPNTGSALPLPARVHHGDPRAHRPRPTTSRPLPFTSVVWPTSTPATSVIASSGPGVPPISALIPRSRARGFGDCAAADAASAAAARQERTRRVMAG
jgi:hypothetical protein